MSFRQLPGGGNSLQSCVALGLGALLITAAESRAVSFTDSNQLSLSGKIAAVNFYYDPDTGEVEAGVQVTSTIQAVTFDNLNVVTQNNVSFGLLGGGTLTISLPHTTEARAQFTATTITGTGADTAPAQQFANDISYFAGGETGSLSFAFGAGLASQPVQVQIVGGDEGWGGTLEASVGGNVGGTFSGDFNPTTAELITFASTTDALGNLKVDLKQIDGNYVGISGVIVTAVPEPASISLVGFGSLALLARRRRQI